MKISVELTFSPLQDDFEPPIMELIKSLRASGLDVKENALSTQVFGEYHQVMKLLQEKIETALQAVDHGLLYIKIVKGDRSKYKADF